MGLNPRSKEPVKAESLPSYRLEAYLHIRLLDEIYDGRTLLRVLLRKLRRRVAGERICFEPVAVFNGLVIFDCPDLHGGGLSFGQNFGRVLLMFGLGRCESLFEFCAGPGYIGYWLLANGFCERLSLADINPRAVEVARKTASYNQISQMVSVYLSDGLREIPREERWDLVVTNPPHLLPRGAGDKDTKAFDRDWTVHREFYSTVKRFMKPGGHVVMMENRAASSLEVFEPMIQAGGGSVVGTLIGADLRGHEDGLYYILSRW